MAGPADRKRRGAWYTPDDLVQMIVDEAVTADLVERCVRERRPLRIVDPACGDGRFLRAARDRVKGLGGAVELVGVDIDEGAVAATRSSLGASAASGSDVEIVRADALTLEWAEFHAPDGAPPGFDLVIGNPPFLSQMAAATTRGGSSPRGGGPYADAAVEFLALGAELVGDAGRVAFVLPQSLLSARDASVVRAAYDERADLVWSWWTGERVFDAQVLTCALIFEFGRGDRSGVTPPWSRVVTSRSGVPDVPVAIETQGAGTLGERARLNANFRDEYYGMIPAVGDHATGPKLITSGLIDPGRNLWGERPVTFAKRRFDRPRIDLAALEGRMPRWARDRSVPKVLIANQTKIIEAVADPDGSTLPGVPVVCAYPSAAAEHSTWEVAAVLTSPIASAWAWHANAGSGLSADAIRVGPVLLAGLPWPAGSLDVAVNALRDGDVRSCAAAVHVAFGLVADSPDERALTAWWLAALDRIEARQPTNVTASASPQS